VPFERTCPFCGAAASGQRCPSCGRDPTASRRVCEKCGKSTPLSEGTCCHCSAPPGSELAWKIPVIILLFALAFAVSIAVGLLR
jgi:predicted amidophosphoribosyltransferase